MTYSPGVRGKLLLVAAEAQSFARAEVLLATVGGIELSSRQINRVAEQAGERLLAAQHDRAERHARKRLPVEVTNPPELAVVEIDGGRIRTRAEKQGPGTHAPAWKESKTAVFLRMSSDVCDRDPAPHLPAALLSRQRVRRLMHELKGTPLNNDEPVLSDPSEHDPSEHDPSEHTESTHTESKHAEYVPPTRLMRTCLASLDDAKIFGGLMAAEAHRKGFCLAERKAFVADGMKSNWAIWKRHFRWQGFVPIVDFIHALSYVHAAAMAIGGGEDFGWGLCLDWATACWQGRVDACLAELRDWLERQPPDDDLPEDDLPEDDPRRIVQSSITYLSNNRERMDYPRYRRLGLPLTSALMESTIKEMNYRVKGSEKFWNNPTGAGRILALRAASLCDDDRLQTIA